MGLRWLVAEVLHYAQDDRAMGVSRDYPIRLSNNIRTDANVLLPARILQHSY